MDSFPLKVDYQNRRSGSRLDAGAIVPRIQMLGRSPRIQKTVCLAARSPQVLFPSLFLSQQLSICQRRSETPPRESNRRAIDATVAKTFHRAAIAHGVARNDEML
jgi:hypothetical protein